MEKPMPQLKNAPIIEAVLDIDCDMPPTLDLGKLESAARETFRAQYPKFRPVFMQEHRIDLNPKGPQATLSAHALQGFHFAQEDEQQIVQVRAQGFSFNRLAPYSKLDNYLPEIERTWNLFITLAAPVQVLGVRLRYVNLIRIPYPDGGVELRDYFNASSSLPYENELDFTGFLNQYAGVEKKTGDRVNIIMASQAIENEKLPVILDITAAHLEPTDPQNWNSILATIQSLRSLKNGVFQNTLTSQCFELFQK